MKTIIFQLGHCPELSFAEIAALNQRLENPLASLEYQTAYAKADCPLDFDIHAYASQLGGTIRVLEFIADRPNAAVNENVIHEMLQNHTLSYSAQESDAKQIFGLSWLGNVPQNISKKNLQKWMLTAAARLKDNWKDREISSRFVLPKEGDLNLSGAQVDKNRLLERGGEFAFWIADGRLQFGVTRWLQPFEDFSKRDYGRPQRDAKSGMLPPKLSRMMINLARREDTGSLLDPFCGSGSLLMEAGLMGLHATGFDISEKAIEDAQANWQWLQSKQKTIAGSLRAIAGDAQQLHKLCEPLYFDCCVTEPYLGPPRSKPVQKSQFESLSKQLHALYIRALGEIRTVVKPGARVVFIVPQFKVQGEDLPKAIPILSDLKFLGYRILDPMNGFSASLRRTPLLYSRPKQIVQREIFILQA